jgi:hypothetical protein
LALDDFEPQDLIFGSSAGAHGGEDGKDAVLADEEAGTEEGLAGTGAVDEAILLVNREGFEEERVDVAGSSEGFEHGREEKSAFTARC